MIQSATPNLMVENVVASARFYQEMLDMAFLMGVLEGGSQVVNALPQDQDLQFAMMGATAPLLMLQSRRSLVDELPHLAQYPVNGGSFTLYFKTDDLEALYAKIDKKLLIKERFTTWYGALEFYMKDPDGYTLAISQ